MWDCVPLSVCDGDGPGAHGFWRLFSSTACVLQTGLVGLVDYPDDEDEEEDDDEEQSPRKRPRLGS